VRLTRAAIGVERNSISSVTVAAPMSDIAANYRPT
jgi:hypothetical protein